MPTAPDKKILIASKKSFGQMKEVKDIIFLRDLLKSSRSIRPAEKDKRSLLEQRTHKNQ